VINTGSGNFDVYFNGVYETSFNDTTFTGGDSGYFAYVSSSSLENFPSTPADMRFKQIDPALSTSHSVQRIAWQDDSAGFVQFSTNDTNDCGEGYFHSMGSQFIPMSSVEMQIKKMSGYSHSGYGIIFCYQDGNNFYRILISVNGSYLISKKVAGTYSYYQGGGLWSASGSWQSSSNLITGFGNTNDIKVVNTGGGNFDIYFNGILETSFTDSTFTGGYNGYYVLIGYVSQENFDATTFADVRLKLIAAH